MTVDARPADAKSEKGAAFIELTIVIPIIFLLSFVVSDVTMFLQNYLKLTHVTREAVRFSVSMANFDRMTCTAVGMSATARRGGTSLSHQEIQGRVQRLIMAEQLEVNPNTLTIQTFCGGANNDRVRVTLSAQYRPILPIPYFASPLDNGLGFFTFSMTGEGEYLFQNCPAPTSIPVGCS